MQERSDLSTGCEKIFLKMRSIITMSVVLEKFSRKMCEI